MKIARQLVIVFSSVVVFLIVFAIFYYVFELTLKLSENGNKANALATAIIALFTCFSVLISYLMYQINKKQATLLLNQSFNSLNQLVLGNPEIRDIAAIYAYAKCAYPHKCCTSGRYINPVFKKSFLLSVLNIYEADYINNMSIFSINSTPSTILSNLLTHDYVVFLINDSGNGFNFSFIDFCNDEHHRIKRCSSNRY